MDVTNPDKKKIFNPDLEILRGVAAMVVVICHIVFRAQLFNKGYIPLPLKYLVLPGHFSVLLFFVLSGYVIGINHKERLVKGKIYDYLKKRFIRIYPIYIVATCLAIVISTTAYSIPTILANFTLTQNISYHVLWENYPAWSLNFEMVFYLLFVPISFFKVKPLIGFILSFVIGIISLYLPVNQIITAYAFGYCFWVAGLYLSRDTPGPSTTRFIPVIFYILAIGIIIGERDYITALNLQSFPPHTTIHWAQQIKSLDDLLLLPFAFLIVVAFSGHKLVYNKIYWIVLQIIPIYLICTHTKEPEDPGFYMGIVFYLLAGLTLLIKIPEDRVKKIGTWFGGISYGIYIIHYPVLIIFGKSMFITDDLWLYIIKVFLYLTVVIGLAYILEKIYQPLFK
jgi:peptidoglycan/LPS O-acetylase OafA/YrhL